jgi:hypothetical protein
MRENKSASSSSRKLKKSEWIWERREARRKWVEVRNRTAEVQSGARSTSSAGATVTPDAKKKKTWHLEGEDLFLTSPSIEGRSTAPQA